MILCSKLCDTGFMDWVDLWSVLTDFRSVVANKDWQMDNNWAIKQDSSRECMRFSWSSSHLTCLIHQLIFLLFYSSYWVLIFAFLFLLKYKNKNATIKIKISCKYWMSNNEKINRIDSYCTNIHLTTNGLQIMRLLKH